MIIGVPNETVADEPRVALTPPVAKKLIDKGHEVVVGSGAGEGSDWSDEKYKNVGCKVCTDITEIFDCADLIVHVRGLGAAGVDEVPYREGQVVVGLLGPYRVDAETLEILSDRNVSAFALELIPRISRAQSMDALSSMASLGGYKAMVKAAEILPKLIPMQMTAAGTVQPAEVFVVGAGVAGLQAIATAERLGASTRAYDIRPEVGEEVESLGAEFVQLDLETDKTSDEQGHAREQDEHFYRKQREMMEDIVGESDITITTASVPGGSAPQLVTNNMIGGMEKGSVIVDLAAKDGGNCEPTVADEVIRYEGVTIHGPTNLPGTLPHTASQLFSNNIRNFIENLLENGELVINLEDEIVDSTLLTHQGAIRNPHEDGEEEPDEEEAEGDKPADADDADEEVDA